MGVDWRDVGRGEEMGAALRDVRERCGDGSSPERGGGEW